MGMLNWQADEQLAMCNIINRKHKVEGKKEEKNTIRKDRRGLSKDTQVGFFGKKYLPFSLQGWSTITVLVGLISENKHGASGCS